MVDLRLVREADGPILEVTGTGSAPEWVRLVGPRVTVTAQPSGESGSWQARLPLRASRWGGASLPLPSGRYAVTVEGAGTVAGEQPITQYGMLRAGLHDGAVEIGPPIDPAYDSGEGQEALERRYTARREQLEDAVFFESSAGRRVGGDPLAIDREIAHRRPSTVRYWSVRDLSVAVPEGAIAIVEGSPQWWRARGVSRLLIVDDWLRRRFARRDGQHVLQTWHGTPIEQVGLRRPGLDWRRWVAIIDESRRWNVLLAQSPYAEEVLRSSHPFRRRPIWVEGSPRNDALVNGTGPNVRGLLGIGATERVLLYAPARRRRDEPAPGVLDAERLARAAGAVVLTREPVPIPRPAPSAGPRVVDVAGFPDTTQLLGAADALVTDFAPAMFDFSVTGKPMYFFVPDLEHRRGTLGGFSIDLAASAPGPVVRTQDALERAILEDDPSAHALAYEEWRATFNAKDDGHAAERVVARLIDEGLLSSP
ncbi:MULTISPECIES: CDP-glycerol glycerophosphotransferase family protein [unclassified Microbacterium]|uniref:CDP-glycerol glycerophosphotransferase family protein n=1 Tax=unclassified Microbacterium TaxID=2609290 RepID=UPI00374573F9